MRIWKGKYLVVRRDGTVPAWPYMVLGARDPFAVHGMLGYANAVLAHAKELEKRKDPTLSAQIKGLKDYAQSVLEDATQWEEYRAKEGDSNPTEGPWRTEAEDVMRALEGRNSVVVVLPDQDNSADKKRTKP